MRNTHTTAVDPRCSTIIQVCELKDFKRIERNSCRLYYNIISFYIE